MSSVDISRTWRRLACMRRGSDHPRAAAPIFERVERRADHSRFETLACGIPLVCSPWEDAEQLFRPGKDYLCVANGDAMYAEIQHLLRDKAAREQLSASGMETICQRHTCRHRAEQLLESSRS